MEVVRNVAYMQAANCRLVIQIGSTAFVWGTGCGGYAARIELLTPYHWFRLRRRIRAEDCRNG